MARMKELAASGEGKKVPSISVQGSAGRVRREGGAGRAGEKRGGV